MRDKSRIFFPKAALLSLMVFRKIPVEFFVRKTSSRSFPEPPFRRRKRTPSPRGATGAPKGEGGPENSPRNLPGRLRPEAGRSGPAKDCGPSRNRHDPGGPSRLEALQRGPPRCKAVVTATVRERRRPKPDPTRSRSVQRGGRGRVRLRRSPGGGGVNCSEVPTSRRSAGARGRSPGFRRSVQRSREP